MSKWRYRELKAIIMQYEDRRRKIRDLIRLPAGIAEGRGQGVAADPTSRAAIRLEKLQAVQDAVDTAASRVEQGERIRRASGYDHARALGYIGSRSDFYRNRRKFFRELDEILQG